MYQTETVSRAKWKTAFFALLVAGILAVCSVAFSSAQAFAGDYGPTSDTISISVEGHPELSATFSPDELAQTGDLSSAVTGYLYLKPTGDWNVVAGKNFVSLDTLVRKIGATSYWKSGAKLQFNCTDGEYTKYYPTYDEVMANQYFFGNTTLKVANATPTAVAPCGVAFDYLQKQIGTDETAQQTINGASSDEWETSTRFCIGLNPTTLLGTGDVNMGKRMPTNVTEIIIVPAE